MKQVIHKPDPLEAKNEMPKAPHVYRRGNVFYVRKRVPSELVSLMKKTEIRVSLETSNRKTALAKAPYALAHLAASFDEERKRAASTAKPVVPLKELPDSEIHQIVASWFIREEKKNETWCETEAKRLPAQDLETILDNLIGDSTLYQSELANAGKRFAVPVFDASARVAEGLREWGVSLSADSASFAKLKEKFRRALVETTARQINRMRSLVPGTPDAGIATGDPFFDKFFAHTPEPTKAPNLGKLLAEYQAHHEKSSSPGTSRVYEVSVRLLRQFFGVQCPLSAIGPQEIGQLMALLEKLPLNAQQRYPGLTFQDAIAAADKNNDGQRIGKRTLSNYHQNIVAIFNFGRDMRMIEDNPAASRIIRDRLKFTREKKTLFEAAELAALFQAPLYTGCVDDSTGYDTRGPNIIRKGRFWVPLLALFQGFRCNEACQLYTEDVKQEDGVWYIWIREGRDSKAKSDKMLKTEISERRVPIHKQVVSMGFLDFVLERQKDSNEPHLFPELPMDSKGYRSNLFSKWFGRFKTKAAPESKATFHSFRHHWRTQLRRADVGREDAEELGGWTNGKRSSEHIYSHGQTLVALKAKIDRLEYPGLDLAHLVPQKPDDASGLTFPKRSRR